MGGAGVVLVRRAVADVAFDDDQRGYVVLAPKYLDRFGDPFRIVRIADPLYWLDPATGSYEVLTPARYAQIVEGGVKL